MWGAGFSVFCVPQWYNVSSLFHFHLDPLLSSRRRSRQVERQHAVGVLGVDVLGIDSLGQRQRAAERTVGSLAVADPFFNE